MPGDCLSCNASELTERLNRALHDLALRERAEQEALDRDKDFRGAQERNIKAAQAGSEATAAAQSATSTREKLKQQHETDSEKAEGFRQLRDAAMNGLTAYFETRPNWSHELLANPAAFENAIAAEVKEFQEQQAARKNAENELSVFEGRVTTAQALAAEREKLAATNLAHCSECEKRRAAIEAERGTLLAGRKTADVIAELEAGGKAARQNEIATAKKLGDARQELAGATASREIAENTLTGCATASAAAAGQLTKALAGLSINEHTLRERLARGQDWIAAQRKRKRELDENAAVALNSMTEKRKSLQDHVALRQVARPLDVLETELAGIDAASETARAERYGLVTALEEDARNRDRDREHREQISRQTQAAELWGGIADLIGAADGKKFRQFAQSLTMEALLDHANTHLTELAPRFHLERVPRNDLEIQVIDRDMGGERRGVSTLSGGESFLVSLALSLSLSSLASSRTRIDSLFIDEGFGIAGPRVAGDGADSARRAASGRPADHGDLARRRNGRTHRRAGVPRAARRRKECGHRPLG